MTNSNDNDEDYDSEDYDSDITSGEILSDAEVVRQMNEMNALVISHWLLSGEGRVPDSTSRNHRAYAESVLRETRAQDTEQERQERERTAHHLEQIFANAGFAGLIQVNDVYTLEESERIRKKAEEEEKKKNQVNPKKRPKDWDEKLPTRKDGDNNEGSMQTS